jgi:hypothetical protein
VHAERGEHVVRCAQLRPRVAASFEWIFNFPFIK